MLLLFSPTYASPPLLPILPNTNTQTHRSHSSSSSPPPSSLPPSTTPCARPTTRLSAPSQSMPTQTSKCTMPPGLLSPSPSQHRYSGCSPLAAVQENAPASWEPTTVLQTKPSTPDTVTRGLQHRIWAGAWLGIRFQ